MEPKRSAGWLVPILLGLWACGRARETRLWAADRAAGALVALDRELCVLGRISIVSPRLLCEQEGVLWVAAARSREAPWPERLVRIDPRTSPLAGMAGAEAGFSALVALCPEEHGTVLVLDRSGARETLLWRVGPELGRTLLGAFPLAQALATQSGELLVGCAGGELARLRADGAVLVLAQGPVPVQSLARGPRAGQWWVLGGGEDACLGLLDGELAPLWSVRTALPARCFAPIEGEERVWIAHDERVHLHGPGGVVEIELELAGGPWEAAVATHAGVLLLGPGALLEVASRAGRARVLRSQGGFDALAALAGVD